MSAAEKLKALDEWMPLHSNQSEPKLWELRRALPQIVAVVEAAERLRWLTDPEGAIGEGRGYDIRAAAILTRRALAALDEALS